MVSEVRELTLFHLPPRSPWSAKKEETLPYLPSRAQASPRNWVQNVTQPRVTPEKERSLHLGFSPSLLHRNTMNLLREILFKQQFGNQPRVPAPYYRRKTYLCYQLKQLNDLTLDRGCFRNKVPNRSSGYRAGRG